MSGAESHTYLSIKDKPLPYCPGCGHTVIVSALGKALLKLQLDPKKTVIVTDIGCIGLADHNFTTSAFHGLHGRSITYACGLKLARPELTVVTLMGDGACGIGGAHLLNVARRNIGITLIVANNLNYGMTGGQHSVTTPTDGLTSTTPFGNVERPLDICATTKAAGAGWVYRATAFDKDLSDIMASAIEEPGFALLEIWELCAAYYSQKNDVKKSDLLPLLDTQGLQLGLLGVDPRPEYSAHYRQVAESAGVALPKRPHIEVTYEHSLKRRTGIVVAGKAGQKIRSAASLLAQAGIASGLHATQKDDYPITVMTGHSLAEVILSPDRIDYTGIAAPDLFVVFAEEGLKRTRARIQGLAESCTVYAEETLDLPETRARVLRFPFAETAKKLGKASIGVVTLACVLERERMFPTEALADTIRTFQKGATADGNLKALEAGAELAAGGDA